MRFRPEDDGVTHINIYSKGATQLGMWLSNWSDRPCEISIGWFKTIEGLIFYLGSFDNSLRGMSGYEAKTKGKELDRGIRLPTDIFRGLIIEAMIHKSKRANIWSALKNSDLPFEHYYVYDGKVVEIPGWQWQVQEWEEIRRKIKADEL